MACSYLFFKYFLHFKLLTSNHALEIYVLNIEENYLTRQLSWKFTYTLRKMILLKMCKKFCQMCYFRLCKCSKFFMSFLKAQVIGQRSQLNSKFFRFSSAQIKIHQIPHVMSFFIVMTHDSSVNFKFINFQLWTKGSHQSPNFDTFECSGEDLPNSSCQF